MAALWQGIVDVLVSPRVIIALVWSGMAVLSVALVVLMRTRWGHQQPLRKCVVLSLFAHLLFVAYATTIHVVRTHPGHGHGTAIRVTAVDGHDTFDAKGTLDGKDGGKESAPWEVDAAAIPLDPELADLPAAEKPLPAPMEVPSDAPTADALAQTPDDTQAVPEAADAGPQQLAPESNQTATIEPPPAPQPDEKNHSDRQTSDQTAPPTSDSLTKLVSQTTPANSDSSTTADDKAATDEPLPSTSGLAPTDRSEAGILVAVRSRTPNTAANQTPVVTGNLDKNASVSQHTVPEMYRERMAPNRLRIAEGYGGSAQTEAAVNSAIEWLIKHQDADGRWDASNYGAGRETRTLGQDRKNAGAQADTGITGLALLAFLGAGHTHQTGPYAKTIERGLNYLIGSQAGDGNLAGAAEIYAFMYCHGMATLALSEAYAMTGDARLSRPLHRAIAYTVAAQNPASGGWRYKPPYPRERGDTSQLGWQLMSLKSAELSGIAIPEHTRQGIVRYLNSVSSGTRGGLASYRPDERPTQPMTAEALVCREFFHLSLIGAGDEAREYLLTALPGQGQPNFYYWYYGTLAMFQMQGPAWAKWNDAISAALTHSQRADGDATGSWDPDSLWGGYGGRVFSTSLGALCLEVYYRYLPLYTATAGREKSAK